MIKSTYNINKMNLYVHCEIEEYCELIEKWLSIYNTTSSKKYDSYIKIYKNKTIWGVGNIERCINGIINHTDLYPLFYNVIANLILNNSNILLHSAVLCYNNVGVLVVGDFNSGKTTLCLNALKNKMKVVSADQTNLHYKKNRLFVRKGSVYMKINQNSEQMLSKDNYEIEIKFILNIVGLCDNGALTFDLVENKNHIIKSLFKFCTWHSDIPLFTKPVMLNIDRFKIYKLLNKIDLPFYNVRGDSKSVVKKIKEILK